MFGRERLLNSFGLSIQLRLECLEGRCLLAPVITSVSQPFVHNGVVRIAGTGFGVKPTGPPLVYADFENGLDPSPLGVLQQWHQVLNMTWDSDEGFRHTGGAKADDGDGSWALRVDSTNPYWNAEGQPFYIYRRTRQNFIIPANATDYSVNWKDWRTWNDIDSEKWPNIYTSPSHDRVYVEQGGANECGEETGFYSEMGILTQRWKTEEIVVKASFGYKQKDGTLQMLRNNQTIANGTIMTLPPVYELDCATSAYMNNNYVVSGVAANKSDWEDPYQWSTDNRYWADDVYVDTTWARVILTNSPEYNLSRRVEIQVPAAWSSQNITITAKTADLPCGSTAYLYVVDGAGTRSAPGFPVQITCSGALSRSEIARVLFLSFVSYNLEGTQKFPETLSADHSEATISMRPDATPEENSDVTPDQLSEMRSIQRKRPEPVHSEMFTALAWFTTNMLSLR
jgi:hypothetical protein